MFNWILNAALKFTGKYFRNTPIFNEVLVLKHPWVTAFYIWLM